MGISSVTTFPANEPGMVDQFLGTAWDVVYAVYLALPQLTELNGQINNIPVLAQEAVDAAMVPAMVEINAAVAQAEHWAQEAEAIAGKVNQQYPFTYDVNQTVYNVVTISGDPNANTTGLALWVGGAIEYDFSITSATEFVINSTDYPDGTAMRIIINGRFDDIVKNFDDLLEAQEEAFAEEQAARDIEFNQYLTAFGYIFKGDYSSGPLTLTSEFDIVRHLDQMWVLNGDIPLPYTTVNDWGVDAAKFSNPGDPTLRRDLGEPTGATRVTHGTETVAQFLDALEDPTESVNKLAAISVAVASVPDLLAITPNPSLEQQFHLASFQPGAFALANPYTRSGGGVFLWDATKAKSAHDGGFILDPGKLASFPSDWDDDVQVAAWFTPGVAGTGCFIRLDAGDVDVAMFGARTGAATPTKNTKPFQQALLFTSPAYSGKRRTVTFGEGLNLITDVLQFTSWQSLRGQGHGSILVFNHAGKGIKIGNGNTPGGTMAPSCRLQDFSIKRNTAVGAVHPSRVVSIEGNSVNVKIQSVLFDAVFATESIITNQSGYGTTLDHVELRYCQCDDSHIHLMNAIDESVYSYTFRMQNFDITGVYKLDGTDGIAIKQDGGQLLLRDGVIQDTGTAIKCGDGVNVFPMLNLDGVFLEANRAFHIQCVGTLNSRALINMQSCRLNHGAGGNIALDGAEIYIAGCQDVGVANFTGNGTSEFTKARVTLGPANGGISPADFSVTRNLIMRSAPAQLVDVGGGAGVTQEIYGIDLNNARHSMIQLTHISGTGNATTEETFVIRHGRDSGNFAAESIARNVGAGGSAGNWTFSSNADGRLFAAFSGAGTWRYTVVSTG